MSLSARDDRWICRRRSDFALRDWPDGSVLFDEANGQLQRLNPSAGRLMALFLENPEQTTGELAKAMFGEIPTAEDIDLVANALENFRSLKLIEHVLD